MKDNVKREGILKDSVFNFVSTAFLLISEAGCGQNPQSLINTGDSSNSLYLE